MAETARCRLVRYLEHLTSEELKKFKLCLVDGPRRGCPPRGRLKEADRTEVADLLVTYLGEKKAWERALSIWEKMGLRELWERARKEDLGLVPASVLPASSGERNKYRERMRNQFQLMRDRNHRPGEHELFQHRFTQLLLLQEYRYKEQKHHELLVQGWRHAKVMEEKGEPIEVSALFDPDQNTGIQPHTVVLQGAAGIGKTTLAIKVMLDWAEGKLYQERFDYVFYLTCRELNPLGMKVISFADLIANDCPGLQAQMTEIMSQTERLLFIIDGLDELKFPCNEHRYDLCKDWKQERPLSILLSSLLRKTLLPEASLLLTTRLNALGKFSPLLENPRHVEILGFSVSQRKEYFCKFFRNEELGKKALDLVEGNAPLFTMCSVPLMNWIICTCLKQQEERGQDPLQALKTTTALYMCYFNSLTPDDKNFMPQHLKGLCGLAAEGIWEGKLLFEEEDLRRHNLEAADVSAFLDMNIFQKDSGCENCYSFIHLTFQEFFAAMFYLMSTDEEWEKSPDFSIPDVKELLEEYSENDASFLALVVQFLFGFLNAEIASELQRKFRCRTSLEMKSQLLEWVERERKRDNGYSCLSSEDSQDWPLLLYETQNAEIVTQALVKVKEMGLMSFRAYDVLLNTFCIKHCPGIQGLSYYCDFDAPHAVWQDFMSMVSKSQYLKELHLRSSALVDIDIRMDKLCMVLRETNCKLEELRLEWFKVPCSCFQYLFSAPSLKRLHLRNIFLDDNGMKLPCETLEKENCQLETLEISCFNHFRVYDMDCSLPENQNNLLLMGTCLQHVMELLCSVLAQQNCKLQVLRLEEFKVPCSCFQYLFSAPSLKSMHLSDIILYDDGMKLPCETLEKENCQLETLEISCLKKWLDSFLPENEKNFFDVTCFQRVMELLCSVLAQQNCKLQTLRLEEFKVPCSCFQYLFSAPSLKSMHLSDIILYDDGMKLPCETLEKENCQLETLEISCLKKWLDSFLPENEKNFFDVTCFQRVMELLCSVLAQQNCKLQTLRLEEFKVPCSCFQYLFSAPSLKSMHLSDIILYDDGMKLPCETLEKENCQLETLEISCLKKWLDSFLPENEKNFFDVTCFQRVMELLCSVLAQQNCKLQTLRLEEFKVPCSCFQYLFSAPSLKSMHLSDIILYDDGMKLPCETLEKENCQLETLEISCLKKWLDSFLPENEKNFFDVTCFQRVMELLCSVLAQQNCKLQTLRLEEFKVPCSCFQYLFSAPSLKSMHLSDIILYDDGMKLPCETLEKENCQLETLEISCQNQWTGNEVGFFLSEKEKKLFPKITCIQHVMELLCSVLAQQSCKLQMLRLVDCHLTHRCSQNLFSALICNKSLKDLGVSGNSLEESGIKLLCEALGNSNCKLGTLRLSRCALTTACLQDLLPVICSSENLKTLDLTLNLFDDEGIKLLCETLEKQDCKLETLFFFQPDGLSEESRRALRNLESRKSFPLIVEDYLDVEDYLYS